MVNQHLAQLNIGRLSYDQDDVRVADFMNNIDRINAVAERSEGFVWRLKDESGDATSISFYDDPRIIVNMSVWGSAEALEDFVWKTVHKQIYNRKGEWFEKMDTAHFVMWWIEPGHIPTLEEAHERLEYLRKHGTTEYAFGWDGLPNVKLWREKRCG